MFSDLQISNKTYFVYTKFTSNEAKCIFYDYDANESWSETQTKEAALKRFQQINERLQLDASIICNTMQNTKPTEGMWFEEQVSGGCVWKTLGLTYHLRTLPMQYQWRLKKETVQEFKESIINPLLMGIQGMADQIKQLRDIVRKKDQEITQYIDEGARLRRTTVQTRPFDFIIFDYKFSDTNEISSSFRNIADVLQLKEKKAAAAETTAAAAAVAAENLKQEEMKKATTKDKQKSRKRKAQEMQRRHVEQHLHANKQTIEYESSQSESLSQGFLDNDPPTTSAAAARREEFELKLESSDEDTKDDRSDSKDEANDSNIDINIDGILKALKELEDRRLADMSTLSDTSTN